MTTPIANSKPVSSEIFKNIAPEDIDFDEPIDQIPGRKDLRISLTTRCNLTCAHCHNEGQAPPWEQRSRETFVTLKSLEELIEIGHRYGAKSVKFSGGEPSVHPQFPDLLRIIARWRQQFPGIRKWGISTNGVVFLQPQRFSELVNSALDNLCVGLDSIRPKERSKPSSSVGISGARLFNDLVKPLARAWGGPEPREIKVNVVYTGDKTRVIEVVTAAYELGINASVIEVNGIMGNRHATRAGFLELINEIAARFNLDAVLDELNEIHLRGSLERKARIKFYQDHCVDRDCGNCRKIHMRVNTTSTGWAAIPCFLQAQSRVLPLSENGPIDPDRFALAMRLNGVGPDWERHLCPVAR